jgi:type IV secretory pathway VirB6-like protein
MYLDHGFRLGLAVALSSLLILVLFSIVEIILRRTRVASSRSYLDSFRSDANSKKQIAARSPKHFSITLTFCFPSLGVIFSTGALAEMAKKKTKNPYNLLEDLAICSHVHSSSSDEHLDKNAQATVQK